MTQTTDKSDSSVSPTEPVRQPKRPVKGFMGLGRETREPSTGIVMEAPGGAEVLDVKQELVHARTGVYHADAARRVWLDRDVKAGWFWVWVQNDPEPVTHRKPVGFTAQLLEWILGDGPLYFISEGFRGRPDEGIRGFVKNWWWIAAIGAGLATSGYLWWKKTHGGG